VAVVLFVFASASCSSEAVSDEHYVEDFCAAELRFEREIESLQDELEAAETAADEARIALGPLKGLVDDLRDARPPEDAAEYHRAVVERFTAVAREVEQDGVSSTADEEFPELPADVASRLDAVAAQTASCREAQFTFSD
jgi:hypothetical protein